VFINRSRLAKADVRGSEFQYSFARLEAATSVKQVYWQYVFLAEKQKLLVYQDSLFSRFLRAAALRAKSGETNSLEMITARSQSFELKNRLFQLRADLQILSKKLRILLNTRELIIPDESGLHKIGFSLSADSLAIVNNPSLAYSMNEAEKARIEKKLERSQMLPDLNVGFFSQTIKGVEDVNGVLREFGPGDRFNGIQAGISVPVWIAPFAARSKAARLNEEAAQTNAEYSQKTISGNYSTLIDELKKYSSTIEYYENQANKEAELIVDQAEKSYRAGALDYLDYVMTLDHAMTIRESYIEALNNYNQTIISIEQVTGKIF
jgi:cobalt-zinc-cadmium resistance protein CzcA